MKYSNPEYISPLNEEQDELVITYNGSEQYFVAESDGASIDERSMVMTKGIIKQSIDNIATPTDSGELPDFSNPVNNFRFFGAIGAILFIVTFR